MNIVTEKINILCADKNISLEELANGAGLTVEQVEKICKSEKIPSLSSLVKIARALGVRLGTFLDDSEDLGPVINRNIDSQKSVTFTSHLTDSHSHMDFISLAARKAGRHMEPFIIDIKSAEDTKILSSHEGEEFIYVLEGSVVLYYGAEIYTLNQGDSIYYDSIVDHLITVSENTSARVLGVVYSPM
jgi:transcriptional regulator with XRE-family HTH domain